MRLIVETKPNYLTQDLTVAMAMAYRTRGVAEQIFYKGEFIGWGVLKDGELL